MGGGVVRLKEARKTISKRWVRKYKEFRVSYERLRGDQRITGYSPELDEAPLNPDVKVRRLAWKLWKATQGTGADEAVNPVVVDEDGDPVPSYMTGEVEVFNPIKQ
jgi:hypothetical protein